ncbi:MAG: hypothetical protein IKV86_02650, partial [Clostridia bacterium]|nr:hypothetical protein [Clostridia bacterium]
MKKRILSFVLLMLMVFSSFASAAQIGYVSVEGDISFSTVTFSNDGSTVAASVKGIKAQGTDNVTLMMTMYNSKKKLVDAASDVKAVGGEEVELKATAPVPVGDFTVAATLYNAASGLAPIAAPAMSDYEGSTDLIDLSVDGVALDGFKSDVYNYSYIVEGMNTYPEIGAVVREGSSKVSVGYEDRFPGKATITVENGLGTVSSVYKIEFKSLKHIVVGALNEENFVKDPGSNLNLMSSGAVSSGVGGKNL